MSLLVVVWPADSDCGHQNSVINLPSARVLDPYWLTHWVPFLFWVLRIQGWTCPLASQSSGGRFTKGWAAVRACRAQRKQLSSFPRQAAFLHCTSGLVFLAPLVSLSFYSLFSFFEDFKFANFYFSLLLQVSQLLSQPPVSHKLITFRFLCLPEPLHRSLTSGTTWSHARQGLLTGRE